MSVWKYERVTWSAFKSGRCEVCGKSAERSVTFEQTINPFNKNADMSVKTRSDITRELSEEARVWQQEPVRHKRCEATR